LTNTTSIFYLTGYSFILTERPAALIIHWIGNNLYWTRVGEDDVPIKNKAHRGCKTYLDYPGEKHLIECFAGFLTEMGLAKKRKGIDNKARASAMWGYKVPTITRKLPDAKFVDMADLVPKMRLIKSPAEIALIKEGAKWTNLAVPTTRIHY